jgi:5-methylcytosine-specific restriction endonuclease McrA
MSAILKKVLLLNSSYEPMNLCSTKKAMTLIFLDKAETVEWRDKEFIRTVNKNIKCPSIIRLKNRTRTSRGKVQLNRKNVFKRDGFKCGYCGNTKDLTIDHIIPKSKGGKSTWENLVTACISCNNKKDDKLYYEVGLKLNITPKVPNHIIFLAQSIRRMEDNWKPYLYLT